MDDTLNEEERRSLGQSQLFEMAIKQGVVLTDAEQTRLGQSQLIELARSGQDLCKAAKNQLRPSELVQLQTILQSRRDHLKDKVFVAHGRNLKAKSALYDFLRSIGLTPLEWEEMAAKTGNGSPYIGEVLQAGFNNAWAAIVLLTPDDEARLNENFVTLSDPPFERELTGQARPNVLLEAGMAFGQFGNRTVLVEIGQLRPISDLAGRHTLRIDNSVEMRKALIGRLRSIGCRVMEGENWLSAGNFEDVL